MFSQNINKCKCEIDSVLKINICLTVDSFPDFRMDLLLKLSKEFYFSQSDMDKYGIITRFNLQLVIGEDGLIKNVRLVNPEIKTIEDRLKAILLNFKLKPAKCNNKNVAYKFMFPYLVDYQ